MGTVLDKKVFSQLINITFIKERLEANDVLHLILGVGHAFVCKSAITFESILGPIQYLSDADVICFD